MLYTVGMTKIAIILALLMLSFPAGASAHKHVAQHLTTDPVPLALAAATAYWGGEPPCGAPTVVEEEEPAGMIKEDGMATGLAERGEGIVLAWTSESESCVIHLNPKSFWWDWKNEDEMYRLFCLTITHEMGHLFGHGDDGQTNPASIEYPIQGPSNFNSVPQCMRTRTWFGGKSFYETEF